MILRGRRDDSPTLSTVGRAQYRAAGADGDGAPAIKNIKAVERCDLARRLVVPRIAAVTGVENYSVRADRPSMSIVFGESNCRDGVSLWQRVLPLPSAIRGLSGDVDHAHHRNQ